MLKIGKYVNTHGIKGEIRILSNFSRKDLIFIPNFKIYIKDKEFIIKSYRAHKNYDMLILDGINNINDIINLKGNDVYINRNDIKEFIVEDLVEYKVKINNNYFKIKSIADNKGQKLILLDNGKYIPYVKEFIMNRNDLEKTINMNFPIDML